MVIFGNLVSIIFEKVLSDLFYDGALPGIFRGCTFEWVRTDSYPCGYFLRESAMMKQFLATVVLVSGVLTGCGGIGEDNNPINPYIGQWKACVDSGSGYYTYRIHQFGKINESEATLISRSENRYTDAACSYRSDTEIRTSAFRVSLTGPISLLGKAGHQGTFNGGEAIYLAVEGSTLYMATGGVPSAWGTGFAKQ